MATNELHFGSKRQELNFLQNFHRIDIEYDGRVYKSVEHLLQASRLSDEGIKQEIADADNLKDINNIIDNNQRYLIEGYELIHDDILRSALRAKFSDPILRKKLIDTYPSKLIYESANDAQMGVGKSGTGKNILGRILSEIRDELVEIDVNEYLHDVILDDRGLYIEDVPQGNKHLYCYVSLERKSRSSINFEVFKLVQRPLYSLRRISEEDKVQVFVQEDRIGYNKKYLTSDFGEESRLYLELLEEEVAFFIVTNKESESLINDLKKFMEE